MFRQGPVPSLVHGTLDYLVGVPLVAGAFLLGFTRDDTATPYLVAVAMVQLMQTIATRFLRTKEQQAPHRRG